MKNYDLKQYAKQKGVHLYEVAAYIGMADSAFSRKYMRYELDADMKGEICKWIDNIAQSEEKKRGYGSSK